MKKQTEMGGRGKFRKVGGDANRQWGGEKITSSASKRSARPTPILRKGLLVDREALQGSKRAVGGQDKVTGILPK